MSDMKYWCMTCKRTLGGFAADNHAADGHAILAQPDPPAGRPRRRTVKAKARRA